MRVFGVRNLERWLTLRREALTNLLLRARTVETRRVVASLLGPIDAVAFVDEYTLIERSLAMLLNVALRGRRVVLVGDSNQQAPIGDTDDQPVRTLLGYRNVCFMYENVRAKDPRLLRRLYRFNVRTNDTGFSTVVDLPDDRTIDVGAFVSSFVRAVAEDPVAEPAAAKYSASSTTAIRRSLIPRVIVTSNAQVNYVNWAIGRIVWSALRRRMQRRRMSRCCLRYERLAIVPSVRVVVDLMRRSRGDDGDHRDDPRSPAAAAAAVTTTKNVDPASERWRCLEDDAFADEQFVIVGMRYRMIQCSSHWPVRIGSRVIVSRIMTERSVRVTTDDDRRLEFTVDMCRVEPYEYNSRWRRAASATTRSSSRPISGGGGADGGAVSLFMFPFVMDAATTVYQVQGLTLSATEYARCYVDVRGMDDRALYVTLSRFENEDQIVGVINKHALL